jgi:predicted ATPase
MARLKSLELSGWKSIKHAQVEFGPLNVLIGANGSGKSNLISFFKLLNDMQREQLQKSIALSGGADSLLHYGAKQTESIDADLRFTADSREFGYNFRLAHAPPDTLVLIQERVGSWSEGNQVPDGWFEALKGGHKETLLATARQGNKTTQWLRTLVDSCRVYHFHDTSIAAPIRQSVYIGDSNQLRADAGNLAAVLARIQLQHPGVYKRITGTIRQINPRFGDFVLAPTVRETDKIMLNWQEQGREIVFGPHQLSDGTLRAIALITLLLQPQHSLPELIVVDEPELGLHPYALGVIAGLFRMASHHCQVIISTQSAQLLDHFGTDNVIVVDRPDVATEFKRLTEPELAMWLEEYTLGELWEKNVFGGGPH